MSMLYAICYSIAYQLLKYFKDTFKTRFEYFPKASNELRTLVKPRHKFLTDTWRALSPNVHIGRNFSLSLLLFFFIISITINVRKANYLVPS